jgi:hypothetical protein
VAYMRGALRRYGMGDNMPDGTPCGPGLVYNSFYESCVNACPSGQAYDDKGICKPVSTVAGIPTNLLMVGGAAVLGLALLRRKKRR